MRYSSRSDISYRCPAVRLECCAQLAAALIQTFCFRVFLSQVENAITHDAQLQRGAVFTTFRKGELAQVAEDFAARLRNTPKLAIAGAVEIFL